MQNWRPLFGLPIPYACASREMGGLCGQHRAGHNSRRLMEKYFQSIFIFTHRLAPESRKLTARYHLPTNCSLENPKSTFQLPRRFSDWNSDTTGNRNFDSIAVLLLHRNVGLMGMDR
jgi:hypothetical protein